MFFVSHYRFQRKAADIEFLVAVEAVSTLVFHGTHGIVIGKITFVFVVLGNSLGPVGLVPVRFSNEENGFGSTLLVLGKTLENAGALLDNLVVFLAFFSTGQRIFAIGNAVQSGGTHFTGLFIQTFRIEHVVQVGTASTPLEQKGEHSKRHIADT